MERCQYEPVALLAAAAVAVTSACSGEGTRGRRGLVAATARASYDDVAPMEGTSPPSPTVRRPPRTPTEEPTHEPEAAPEPKRSFVTIPAIGLEDFPVVRYPGSPDDAPGTALQNAGEMASPRGARGGVGPGEVGNYIVTGHRLTGTAPLRNSPSCERGPDPGAQRRHGLRLRGPPHTLDVLPAAAVPARAAAPVPGRIGEEATEPMITLSTCATLEDHANGNYWSDEFDNPEHRIDKIGVLVADPPRLITGCPRDPPERWKRAE